MKKFCTGVYSYLMSSVMYMSLLLNAAGLAVMFGFMLVEMVGLNKRTVIAGDFGAGFGFSFGFSIPWGSKYNFSVTLCRICK